MFRLLDYEDLPIDFHEETYRFVQENWDRFLEDTRRWSGGADEILSNVRTRLKNPNYPRSKDWVYLASAMPSPGKESIRVLIEGYLKSDNIMVRSVPQNVLERPTMKLE